MNERSPEKSSGGQPVQAERVVQSCVKKKRVPFRNPACFIEEIAPRTIHPDNDVRRDELNRQMKIEPLSPWKPAKQFVRAHTW